MKETKSEIELLKAICKLQVTKLMDKLEWNTYPKYRKVMDYEIRLSDVCLWHTNLWSSSKRKYVAEKLKKENIIDFVKKQKHSPICVRFIDEKYNNMIFNMCEKSIVGFEYVVGNGFNSYPQYTKTNRGIYEVDRITEIIFNEIVENFNLD